jgi:iron complex outermembrane receptor protein
VLVNNLLNNRYETNGYTYGYILGGETVVENFYFPQAGRNFLVGLTLKL